MPVATKHLEGRQQRHRASVPIAPVASVALVVIRHGFPIAALGHAPLFVPLLFLFGLLALVLRAEAELLLVWLHWSFRGLLRRSSLPKCISQWGWRGRRQETATAVTGKRAPWRAPCFARRPRRVRGQELLAGAADLAAHAPRLAFPSRQATRSSRVRSRSPRGNGLSKAFLHQPCQLLNCRPPLRLVR